MSLAARPSVSPGHDVCSESPAKGATLRPEEESMSGGKMDQAKGRAKEAVGVLTGNKRLEREGKVERTAGDIKEKAGELADDVKKGTAKIVDKVKSAIKRR
jgi:uncharacterized protein YjbJ (UPF0337 family)